MKVLKFGGSSVGTSQNILNVRRIVEGTDRPVIVVVSALGGVTDTLIRLGRMAAAADYGYRAVLDEMVERHHRMVAEVIAADKQAALTARLDALFDELRSILQGLSLLQDLTPKTADAIVAYGERLSSLIAAALIPEARHYDSRAFIRTRRQGNGHIVDFDETRRLPLARHGNASKKQPRMAMVWAAMKQKKPPRTWHPRCRNQSTLFPGRSTP